MQSIRRTIVLVFFAALAVNFISRCDASDVNFPQLSAEVNYADVEKRIEWMAERIQNDASFHELLDPPALEKVNHVPNYESKIVFFGAKSEDGKYVIGMIESGKRSPKRSTRAHIGFYENGVIGGYEEFMLGRYITVYFNETGKLSNIEFEDFFGKREIKFDENGKVLTDTYRKFGAADVRFRLEQRDQMAEEIRASIEAGCTATQLQEPKEWKFKMPQGLDGDELVHDRLVKIGEYHQAVVTGKVLPLLDTTVFSVENDDTRPHVYVFYSGKKVAFVGVQVLENFRYPGYFMVFDEYSRLVKYVEGEINFDQNLTGHEVAKSAKLFLRDLPGEQNRQPSGLEIIFHATGYPASYKTIVKGELIGRQIEWDENGNVLSDDDIPPPPDFDSDKPVIVPELDKMRTWHFTSDDGEQEIEALLVSISDGTTVALEQRDGTMVHVERSSLSADDQESVRLFFVASLQASGYSSEEAFFEDIKSLNEAIAAESVVEDTSPRTSVKTTTIRIPRENLRVQYDPHSLPEPSNRWTTMLWVNGVILAIILALYFYRRWRNG